MKIWNWLRANSSALQGVAAFVVIIGAFIASWGFLEKAFSPDITVRVNINESTLPNDLVQFNNDILHFFEWDKDALSGIEDKKRIDPLLKSPILEKINASRLNLDKARIEVINQSENTISGVRLRLDDVLSLWGIEVEGTFLDKSGASNFRDKLHNIYSNDSIIFPELPSIPSNSSLIITVYGHVNISKPFITTSGQSFTVIEVVEVENGKIIEWYRKPWLLLTWIPLFISVAYIFISIWWVNLRRRIVDNAKKGILYDAGCVLATDGQDDEAMVLLNEAVKAGYSNRQHAIKDSDLESLRDREDFKQLFKET